MNQRASLLIEIGTEELPPGALVRLSQALTDGIAKGLVEAGLSEAAVVSRFETPRRMAVRIADVADRQADREQQRLGPAVAAAFDDEGKPTRAAEGFARSVGVTDVADLSQVETDKGVRLGYTVRIEGRSLDDILPELIGEVAQRLPIPKLMRWGDRDDRFVRPVHWVAVLHGDRTVPGSLFGCEFGRNSRGHRFQHPGPVWLTTADDYEDALKAASVTVSTAARRSQIAAEVEAIAKRYNLTAQLDDELLDEVANLVEWPVAIYAEFDQEFLKVPDEALVSSMQKHQRFFPLRNSEGHLAAAFVGVANVVSAKPDEIRKGYERVIRPRLADAKFFFDQDQKTPLENHLPALDGMVYQKELGSIGAKSDRVRQLAERLAGAFSADADKVSKAATLAKCDLLTDMVGEFPDLQGIMGDYYARIEGMDHAVATALREQYQPRFAGDAVPATANGRCLATAERIDTLVGIFGAGLIPSGTRDPYALRRAALGVIRIALSSKTRYDLIDTLDFAISLLPLKDLDQSALHQQVNEFIRERLRGYLADQGVPAEIFNAVAAVQPAEFNDFVERVQAVRAFMKLEAAESLCSANKRIANILRKNDEDIPEFSEDRITDDAESALAEALRQQQQQLAPKIESRAYGEVLTTLAALGPAVDRYFDEVLVMADDPELRLNRLAMLSELQALFMEVADIGIAA